ncbi:unnamed protein product [Chondrus crispus]|uniref:Uncharacterized protein n=1 Tax=Chondrus crispus TaxID=2769 RepID=R7Q9C8_CHOCR|nr:unnamed protein product [Chondrus crispus]CDF34075.1 unnamed protein product [Chondrus crispus]|eukprot:XP_005713894.1 unnamed protein product [Chondrus crispus]
MDSTATRRHNHLFHGFHNRTITRRTQLATRTSRASRKRGDLGLLRERRLQLRVRDCQRQHHWSSPHRQYLPLLHFAGKDHWSGLTGTSKTE